jgi:DNA-directed RNA polymerase specialized sigma24 family protein
MNDEEVSRPALKWRSTPRGVLQAIVMHALHLQPALRETFILCDIQGCSITETAFMMGTNPDLVIRRLQQARCQMDEIVTRLSELPSGQEE